MSSAKHAAQYQVRVSTIGRSNKKYVSFSGPLIKNGVASSRFIAFVSSSTGIPLQLSPGQIWEVNGFVESREKKQVGNIIQDRMYIHAKELTCLLPTEGAAFIRLLTEDKGFKSIGANSARKLWNAFGNRIYSAIRERNVDEIRQKAGFTEDACERLFDGMSKYENLSYNTWLCKLGVPVDVIVRVIKYHKHSTIDMITENPFRLMDFGLSFSEASYIARTHFDCEPDDPQRLAAAVDESLKRIIRQGHTYALKAHVTKHLFDILKDFRHVDMAIDLKKSVSQVIVSPKLGYWHPTSQLVQEYTVAKRLIAQAAETEWTKEHDDAFCHSTRDLPFQLSDKQKEATVQALKHGAYAITGGAGTGKTTVLRTILKVHDYLGYEIDSIAVSGRAGMRMQESTGFSACTVAKFLQQDFTPDETKRMLVIDEASMIDINTMFKIITRLSPDTKILLVGDANQLPPIQSGLVFHDVLESNAIPKTRLDIVQRQDENTGIPAYSAEVINGVVPDQLTYKNITFHDTEVEKIEKIASSLLKQLNGNDDVQIVAMSKRGYKQKYGGVEQLNSLCQKELNPRGKRFEFDVKGRYEFVDIREDDPVLFTQNNYDAGVWNGTLGKVVSVKQSKHNFGKVITDTEEEVDITETLLDSLQLGYAMTVHKAQGSQFKRVIIVLTNPRMLNRNWLYTAITRAEEHVDIIGPKDWLINAIQTVGDIHKRRSFLFDLLVHKSFKQAC